MISIPILLSFLLLHWLGDFVFQSDRMAAGKSKSLKILFEHVGIYSATIMIGYAVCLQVGKALGILWWPRFSGIDADLFLLTTFGLHFVIDYWTSRGTAYLYARGDRHNFFVLVGFDQLLHGVCLVCAFDYFTHP